MDESDAPQDADLQRLVDRATRWADHDPDQETATALRAMAGAKDAAALAAHVGTSLSFGTAGLRGEVGPGPNRMNRAVVLRATHGVAAHVRERVDDGPARGVVVGHDARPDSARFARDVITVLAGAGIAVAAFDEAVPTPVVAWEAVRRGAAGAIVVTASHNPPADNGYKVYDEYGVQITPPTDEQIAASIDAAPPADEVLAAATGAPEPAAVERLGAATVGDYVDDVVGMAIGIAATEGAQESVRLVVTPMHGVGGVIVEDVLVRLGHDVVRVEEQWEPDGSFPTVAFPNPEEPGALDLSLATATSARLDVVFANDPDADRLAVAIRGPDGWRRLTGDEVGILLADHLLERATARGEGTRLLVANSIVSSARLARVAAAHGARHEVTLTGFKWLWRAGRELAADGWRWVMGYEEALGYSVGTAVRDKDGISAAAAMAQVVAGLTARGRTLHDALADLDDRYGRWVNVQHSVRFEGTGGPAAMAAAVDAAAGVDADVLGVRTIERIVDHREPEPDAPAWRPPSPLVVWHLAGDGRILVRPSGTEPKLKLYVDLPLEPEDDPSLADRLAARAATAIGVD